MLFFNPFFKKACVCCVGTKQEEGVQDEIDEEEKEEKKRKEKLRKKT